MAYMSVMGVQYESREIDVRKCDVKSSCIRYEKLADKFITVFKKDRSLFSVAQELVDFRAKQEIDFPFMVMNVNRISTLVQNWLNLLPRVQPFYSLSCNTDPVLLRLLANYPQFGFYCKNRFELEKGIELVNENRILYGNPLWTRKNICIARDANVNLVICESESELLSFQKSHSDARIILRVCMNAKLADDARNVGCELFEEAPRLLRLAWEMQLTIVGISFTLGYGIQSGSLMKYAIAHSRKLFDIAIEIGHDMCILDIGSSFPGSSQDSGLSFAQIAGAINEALDVYFPECSHGNVQVISEPGRYFAASAFSLLTNITEINTIDLSFLSGAGGNIIGFTYRTNEGFFGSFDSMLSHNKPNCRPLYDTDNNILTYATIVGPSIEHIGELDVLQPLTLMRKMEIGEWLIWENMGAYSMQPCGTEETKSPTVFYYVSEENWHHVSHAAIEQSLMVYEFAKAANDYFQSMSDSDTVVNSEGDTESLVSSCEFANDAIY